MKLTMLLTLLCLFVGCSSYTVVYQCDSTDYTLYKGFTKVSEPGDGVLTDYSLVGEGCTIEDMVELNYSGIKR